jgi:hypothetical protein
MTNWNIARHPLRSLDQDEDEDPPDEEGDEERIGQVALLDASSSD